MPLHLQAITNDSQNTSLLAWILQKGMDDSNSIFISSDAMYFHIQRNIVDTDSNTMIGRLIYTIKRNEEQQALEILDLDIVLENNNPSKIHFQELQEGSSDSNEYYEVETVEGGHRLEIETVNRYTEPKSILGTERDVFISVFPFKLSVYQDIEAFNKWAGISKPIQVGETEWRVGGFSETFCMPGGTLNAEKKDVEHYSFLIGKVRSFSDVSIAFGEFNLPFVLAQVDTALGRVPVAIGKDVFDISNLKEGCIVAMNADVKADLSRPEQFKELSSE